MKNYCVYILTNKPQGVLYIGVTGHLQRRMIEHRLGKISGFTKKYFLKKLVYVESYQYVNDALRREKQLKFWLREWKLDLITTHNPEWRDLYKQFFGTYTGEADNRMAQDPGAEARMTECRLQTISKEISK